MCFLCHILSFIPWLDFFPQICNVFTQFQLAVILGCQNSLYSSLDRNPYYFVNGWIITSLVGFPVDWPVPLYIGAMRRLIMAFKKNYLTEDY